MRPSLILKPTTLPPSRVATASVPDRPTVGLAAAAVVALLSAYKALISPHFSGCCRFEPSCSDYMRDAVRTRGAARGVWLGVRRLLRCHPFGAYGVDPCPPNP